jgi:SHS2 domain-containing protein
MRNRAAGFEVLEHTADIGLRARAASLGELFEQATLGLAEVLGARWPERAGVAEVEAVPVEVEAPDLGGLLVDWLGEVLYLHEVRRAGVAAVRVEHVTETPDAAGMTRAKGVVMLVPPAKRAGGRSDAGHGRPAEAGDEPFEGIEVKAVTYHRLTVERDPGGGWLAEVYLDV